MDLIIMRHGQTPGNGAGAYVGVLDHPLSEVGREQAKAAGIHPEIDLVYVTPLSRTHETASICFPNARQVEVDGLQEMDFGAFAGRTADEMEDDPDYRAWVDGMCEGRCPGGESRAEFSQRICCALSDLIAGARQRGEERVILVAHGGTMMAALDAFAIEQPEFAYYGWLVGNCQGYCVDVQVSRGGTLILADPVRFENLDFLSEEAREA
ncbi:MAG: histidine phosphatase family protein [Eggerthellaceae bacterium]|nr:histidine phosphatase family protein [Eggerthellaceae bacterium]